MSERQHEEIIDVLWRILYVLEQIELASRPPTTGGDVTPAGSTGIAVCQRRLLSDGTRKGSCGQWFTNRTAATHCAHCGGRIVEVGDGD